MVGFIGEFEECYRCSNQIRDKGKEGKTMERFENLSLEDKKERLVELIMNAEPKKEGQLTLMYEIAIRTLLLPD